MAQIRINVEHVGCPIGACRCPEARQALSRQMREAVAIGVIALRLRYDPHGRLDAWTQTGGTERHAVARRLLRARLRLNRAGLLRWRVVRRDGGAS